MFTKLLLTFCLMLASSPAFAQKATVKVLVTHCEWSQPQVCQDNSLSGNQMEWWLKEGKKKFPNVQLVEDRDSADWVLAWAATSTEYQTPITATSTTTGNQTNTTINPSQTRYVNFVEASLRRKDASIPDHVARHSGRWLWSKPDKDAFEKLIKAIAR